MPLLAVISSLIAIATLGIPMYVIRPFRPQGAREFAIVLTVRGVAPWVSALCVLGSLSAIVLGWKASGTGARVVLSLTLIVTIAGACLTHINVFEVMSKPYPAPEFEASSAAHVDVNDKVLAVTFGGQSHAYPIRTMGYHHIVNDVIAGTPIAVTYCTLYHTGLIGVVFLTAARLPSGSPASITVTPSCATSRPTPSGSRALAKLYLDG